MNDASLRAPRTAPVRPRDAASLILLRGAGDAIEVLVGRRSLKARFMPGVYVFPGGRIEVRDGRPWQTETGADALPPRLVRGARAALRETWEEVGVLFGAASIGDRAMAPAAAEAPIEGAYRASGLAAAIDRLRYVGRAITPPHSRRRFNTRFFLGDGDDVFGEPRASEELEDARWRRLESGLVDGFADVTRFMLARALELRGGAAFGAAPLFYWAKNARRIGVCREDRR